MMTNVRASNLHPAFLLLRGGSILDGPRTLLASHGDGDSGGGDDGSGSGGGGFPRVSLVNLPSAAPYPPFTRKALKPSPSTERDVTLVSETEPGRGGRVLSAGELVGRSSSRPFGKLPLFLSCGNIPVADIRPWMCTRTQERAADDLRGIRSLRGHFLVCRLSGL